MRLVRVTDEKRMSRNVFAWLLLETSWRSSVRHLERQVQTLQQEVTTIAGDRAFEKLTSLRRQLANAYELLRDACFEVDQEMEASYSSWHAGEKLLSAEEFWAEERCKSAATNTYQAQSIDLRELPDLMEGLLEEIKTMTRTVNEEIQMVIGSVQVEDARVMRRQTEWTVVLAVLAAVYLPMTLVTGIFGMNITEIGAEATAPNRWSVVKAWGVVFGATMGSVFVYAMVRYLLRYRHIGRMLLRRRMMKVGDRSMYRRFLPFKKWLQQMWLYQKIRRFREKMREWDVEAQKMEKVE